MQCSAEEWHVSAGGGEAQCHHIGHRQSGLPPISGLPASAVPHYLASFKLIQRPLSHLIYTRRKLFTRELFSLFFLFIFLHLQREDISKIYFCMILADNHEHNWHILQKYVIHQFGAHGMFNHFHYINFLSSKFSIIIIKTTSKNILHSEKFSAFQNEIYYFYLPSGFQGRSSSTNNIWKLSRNLEYTRLPNLVKHISTYRLIADCDVVM